MTFASVRRLIASRHCAWLLVFALWLPGAQWAAAAHTLLHLHTSIIGDPDRVAQLPGACELCIAAATVGSGGAVAPLPALPGLEPGAAAPLFLAHAAPASRTALPYRSRAPPLPHA
jgi:hypothetical protein